MNPKALIAIERTAAVLAAATTAVAGVVWGPSGFFAAGAGAALACANLWAIRRLAARAFVRVLNAPPSDGRGAGALGAGLMLKMLLLFVLVYLAVGPLGFAVAPFALGVSVLVAGPVLSGLYLALREAA